MKNFIALSFLFLTLNCFTQNVAYVYDNAGNRVQRIMVAIPSGLALKNNDNTTTNHDVSAEIKEKEDTIKIADSKDNFNFLLFPNPTLAEVSVQLDNEFMLKEFKEISIFDNNGTLLEKQMVNASKVSLDLSKYANGNYFVRLIAKDFSHEWLVLKN